MDIDEIDFTQPLSMQDLFNIALIFNAEHNQATEPEIYEYARQNILNLQEKYEKKITDSMSIVRRSRTVKRTGKMCPYCEKNLFVIRKGFDKSGRQKFRCTNCKKYFL